MVSSLNRASRSGTPPPQNLPAPASEVDPLKQQLGDGSAPRFKRLPSHGTNIGRRRALQNQARELVELAPATVQSVVATEQAALDFGHAIMRGVRGEGDIRCPHCSASVPAPTCPQCEKTVHGVRGSDRTCLTLWPQLVGWLGTRGDAAAETLIAQLGIQSLDVARQALRMREAAAATAGDPEALERDALEYLQTQRRLTGRPLLIDPLASHAEVEP